jgi:Domain of unknown function (DUF4375)
MKDMKDQLPWLDYVGQSSSELITCRSTHRTDSLLCAFETALEFKVTRLGKRSLSAGERLLLAVMALDREVNNGGYDQFLRNSSRQYAPIVVASLRRIGCDRTAALTGKALAALKLPRVTVRAVDEAMAKRSTRRDRILDECDSEYYTIGEIERHLFAFVAANEGKFQLIAGYQPPPPPDARGYSAISAIFLRLEFAKKAASPMPAGLLNLAMELAKDISPVATPAQIEAAVALFLFAQAVDAPDSAAAEPYAAQAFELAREETQHCVAHYRWIKRLLESGRRELAEMWTLKYLDYLRGSDRSRLLIENSIDFWAGLLREHPGALPDSEAYFAVSFRH